jgi:hypothetical protein
MNKVKIDGAVYERVDGYASHDINEIPEVSGKPLIERALSEGASNNLEMNYNALFLTVKTAHDDYTDVDQWISYLETHDKIHNTEEL